MPVNTTILNTNETHSTLITINVAAQTPVKLTSTNYLAWKLQFQTLFIGYDLNGFIDGSHPCPATFIPGTTTPNPAHNLWIRQDQLLLNAILGSLSPTIMSFIAQAQTSKEAWTILANTYAKPSRGRIKQVKSQFKQLTKGSLGISEFLQTIKARADELAILGAPVDIEDLSERILEGLGSEYTELARAVQARDTPISFDELHEKLLNFEASIHNTNHTTQPYFPASAHIANRAFSGPRAFPPGRHTGWRPTNSYNSRFSNSSSPGPPNSRPSQKPYHGFCQICRIQGHTAKYCPSYKLIPINTPTNNNSGLLKPPWQPKAHYATNSPHSNTWLLDSGASHHVTSDLNNLSLHTPYNGPYDIMIGDGTGLPITHTGSTSLLHSNQEFSLTNVLCVPNITKNLISISKFCISNNASIEFLPFLFLVKDLHTGAILLKGKATNGVYEWPPSTPLIAFSSTKTTSFDWHHRLGHPALPILNHVISKYALDLTSSRMLQFSCNACHCNKSHKLSFSKSTLTSTRPLQIIFSDVWTSPILSSDGFKYYVIFVDHFTKYIWLYPLTHKSQVKDVFLRFKAITEKHFNQHIHTLYSDNGGEYVALTHLLLLHGISHRTTPPHTPEHNGFSERRHLHIVETGLTLLAHASIPLRFWPHAFATAVYLINRMPTPTLNLCSPYEKIFGYSPNYSKLKVFGCLCYPWLRPYTSHKLEPRSKPCIFFGYSLTQSAYLCYDPSTTKVFVSCHVKFVESIFPFTSTSSQEARPDSSTVNTWIPQPIPVSTVPPPLISPSAACPHQHLHNEGPSASSPASEMSLITTSPNPTSPPSLPLPDSLQLAVPPTHPMQTRAKNNIHKPLQKLNLHTTLSPHSDLEPTTSSQALKDPKWRQAMSDEFNALIRNGTWQLIPASSCQNIVGCKWIFRTKRHSNGSVDRYKVRLSNRPPSG